MRVFASIAGSLGRRLRHGLVIATLALFTAVAVGASGAVLSTDRDSADAASSSPERNSLQVLRDLLGARSADEPAAADPAPSAAPAAPARAAPSDGPAPSLPRVVASAGSALARLPERPSHAQATPPLQPGDRVVATISFYYCLESPSVNPSGDGGDFCGAMRDGVLVYPGAAACDLAYLGQRFRVLGDPLPRIYTCNDTGSAVHGLHRDIWFYASDEGWDWQRVVGTVAVLEVVR